MSKKSKILAVAATVLIAGAAIFGVSLATKDKPAPAPSQNTAQQTQQAPATEVSYKGEDGKNALELLKRGHKVETTNYSGLGDFVTSIDGATADSKHFWAFYVNESQAQVGASAYVTKSADTITWKLEEIK
jgi:hypothetical protein